VIRFQTIVILMMFVCGIAAAQLVDQSSVVTITLSPESLKVDPGSRVKVVLHATIAEGFHINSNTPNDEFLIPVTVESADSSWPIAKVSYPAPKVLNLAVSEKPLSAFEGKTDIGLTFDIGTSTPTGKHVVPVEFGYQACDDRSCLPPRTITANLTFEVTGAAPEGGKVLPPQQPAEGQLARQSVKEDGSSSAGSPQEGSLLVSLLFAFTGGIILNLMPCVLPVLSLKILGFVQQAGEDKKKTLRHGLVFTAGVLISFLVLAGILLILRAGGEQLGWGFQLQSPTFLILLSVFFFLFSLSLFGVFEIGTAFTRVQGGGSGYAGSFMSGVTATVIATPCTAPFMGSALGYGLTQPAYVSLLIFGFLGLGMASPYLLLAANPRLLKFVPRPGAWMETFKQFMGFLLAATTLWLIWVLSFQVETESLVVLLFALLFAALGAWIWGKWGTLIQASRTRIIALVLSLALIGGATYKAIDSVKLATGQKQSEWLSYSPALVEQLRREKKPLFIDFTAKWCLTCQVNERVTLQNEEVRKAFADRGVTLLVADWTNQDSTIAHALAQFNRNSVPLYVLYTADEKSPPVVLPEILTPGIVLEALKKL
jgi:thiol:disulfide interchange protein